MNMWHRDISWGVVFLPLDLARTGKLLLAANATWISTQGDRKSVPLEPSCSQCKPHGRLITPADKCYGMAYKWMPPSNRKIRARLSRGLMAFWFSLSFSSAATNSLAFIPLPSPNIIYSYHAIPSLLFFLLQFLLFRFYYRICNFKLADTPVMLWGTKFYLLFINAFQQTKKINNTPFFKLQRKLIKIYF